MKLMVGQQLHEGQRADAGALGLLALFTAQAVVDGGVWSDVEVQGGYMYFCG